MRSTPLTQFHLTYHDLDMLPDFIKYYEVWEGALIMMPLPLVWHQMILMNLLQVFGRFDPDMERGICLPKPLDVVLREDIILQPSILYVVRSRREIIKERYVMGAPDLCVEVLSPSTSAYDLSQKQRYYEEAGVREYWIVNPAAQTLTVHGLAAGTETKYDIEQTAVSTLPELEGLQVDIAKLFAAF